MIGATAGSLFFYCKCAMLTPSKHTKSLSGLLWKILI